MKHKIIQGDCLRTLAELPSDAFQTCITSPPYFQLRDYGVAGQIGLEDSLDEHLQTLVDVFAQVRRVLRPDGTLWVNYGDAYENKQLLGLPWRLAFALQADGWWLRSDIIWHKLNPMPESATDRPTKAHEYLFLLSPSQKYFYDADGVKEPAVRAGEQTTFGNKNAAARNVKELTGNMAPGKTYTIPEFRNLRDVWTIPSSPFTSAPHYATFPPALVEPCIKAGSRPGDDILDPFAGAGTVGLVADRLGRNSTLLELNPEYIKIMENRIYSDAPLFTEIDSNA